MKFCFGDTSKFYTMMFCKLSFCSHKNRAISTKLKILEFKTLFYLSSVEFILSVKCSTGSALQDRFEKRQ